MDKRRSREARGAKRVEHEQAKAEMMEWERIRREKELQKEIEANEFIAATMYSMNTCTGVFSNTFENLRQHKFLAGYDHDAELFKPLVHQQMYRHLQVPRMIVNDIIRNVESERLVDFNVTTLLSVVGNLKSEEKETSQAQASSEEEEDYSSLVPPPNTASSLPNTSEGEDESIGF